MDMAKLRRVLMGLGLGLCLSSRLEHWRFQMLSQVAREWRRASKPPRLSDRD